MNSLDIINNLVLKPNNNSFIKLHNKFVQNYQLKSNMEILQYKQYKAQNSDLLMIFIKIKPKIFTYNNQRKNY